MKLLKLVSFYKYRKRIKFSATTAYNKRTKKSIESIEDFSRKNYLWLEKRPFKPEDRSEFGHWEGDR